MRSRLRDEGGQDIEQGGLARAGAARDDDVHSRQDAGPQEFSHFRGEAAELDELVHSEGFTGKLSDRQRRPVDGQGRDDGVDTRAIGKPRINQGRGLVDPSAHPGDDPFNDPAERFVRTEFGIRFLQMAVLLHVDAVMAVDHDFRDFGIVEETLDRAVAQHVVDDFAGQALPFSRGERNLLPVHDLLELILDVLVQLGFIHRRVGDPGAEPLIEGLAGPFLEPAEGLAGHAGVGADFFDHECRAGSIGGFGFLNPTKGRGDVRGKLGLRRNGRLALLVAVPQLFKSAGEAHWTTALRWSLRCVRSCQFGWKRSTSCRRPFAATSRRPS